MRLKLKRKQNGEALVVILYLINKDQIFIPLIKRADNHDFNFDNYKYQQTSTTTTTQYINQPYYTKDVIPHEYLYNVTTDTNINPTYITSNQNQQNYYINSTKNIDISGAIPVSPGGNPGVPIQKKSSGVITNQNVKQNIINQNPSPYPITDTSQNNYINYQFENNQMGKVEENTNILKAEQQKLKNDMKRLMSESEKLKEQNEVCELQEVVEAKNMTEFTKVITDNIVSLYTISKKEDSDNTNNNGND